MSIGMIVFEIICFLALGSLLWWFFGKGVSLRQGLLNILHFVLLIGGIGCLIWIWSVIETRSNRKIHLDIIILNGTDSSATLLVDGDTISTLRPDHGGARITRRFSPSSGKHNVQVIFRCGTTTLIERNLSSGIYLVNLGSKYLVDAYRPVYGSSTYLQSHKKYTGVEEGIYHLGPISDKVLRIGQKPPESIQIKYKKGLYKPAGSLGPWVIRKRSRS